ncbi:MAG: phage major capsid protein [Eubacterium sp.]
MAFDNIKLEKGLYTTGKSFTDALESVDPSENYRGTSLEGLDAYELQLKRFDIKVSGRDSDTISKFFSTTDAAVLFPEYISRAVKTGMDRNDKVEKVIATTTDIDSLDYRSIKFSDSMEFSLLETEEGGIFEDCQIVLESELTPLKKYGRMLSASYEAIKYQKLDVFSIALKHIGETISNDQFVDALATLGASPDAKTIDIDYNNISYATLVEMWKILSPFNFNTVIASKEIVAKLLLIPEMRDSNAGLDFHGTGKMITPFGAEVICPNLDGSENLLVGMDKNNAIERVQAGGVITEFDKLIDRQIERAAISTIVGFSPIYGGAVVSSK